MRRFASLLTILLTSASLLVASSPPPAHAQESQLSGRLLLVGKNGISPSVRAEVAQLGGELDWIDDGLGLATATGLPEAAIGVLSTHPDLRAAEPERLVRLAPILDGADLTALPPIQPASPAGAFWYPRQWNLPTVHAQAAWDAGVTGSADVSVAVIDSGIDYTHPDLVGLVDLSRSISLVPLEDAEVAALYPGRHPITDLNTHGTVVSSIIASNAGIVAGIGQQTTLFGIKACDRTGDCLEAATLQALVYAVDAGADVVNLSLSGYGGSVTRKEMPGLTAAINRAFNYAHQNVVTVVVAAGNQLTDLNNNGNEYVPYCDAPHVICVSATGPHTGGFDGPWPDVDSFATLYSNSGSPVTVAAPGGNGIRLADGTVVPGGILWGACSTTIYAPGPPFDFFCGAFGVYPTAGTSFAAPHVSGLAALLVDQLGRNPQAIRQAIRSGADDLGKPGEDRLFGAGRINVARSLGLE